MEQMVIRNLPDGTKAALRARAERRRHSVEAEVRDLIADALSREPTSIVDLLATDDSVEFDIEPERLGLRARTADL